MLSIVSFLSRVGDKDSFANAVTSGEQLPVCTLNRFVSGNKIASCWCGRFRTRHGHSSRNHPVFTTESLEKQILVGHFRVFAHAPCCCQVNMPLPEQPPTLITYLHHSTKVFSTSSPAQHEDSAMPLNCGRIQYGLRGFACYGLLANQSNSMMTY